MPRRKNHLAADFNYIFRFFLGFERSIKINRPRCPEVRDTNALLVETEGIEEQEKERKRATDTLKAIDKEI